MRHSNSSTHEPLWVVTHTAWVNSENIMCKVSFCEILTFIFLGFHEKFPLVLLQITNYIFLALEKNPKKNAILFKLFWYKILCPLKSTNDSNKP